MADGDMKTQESGPRRSPPDPWTRSPSRKTPGDATTQRLFESREGSHQDRVTVLRVKAGVGQEPFVARRGEWVAVNRNAAGLFAHRVDDNAVAARAR